MLEDCREERMDGWVEMHVGGLAGGLGGGDDGGLSEGEACGFVGEACEFAGGEACGLGEDRGLGRTEDWGGQPAMMDQSDIGAARLHVLLASNSLSLLCRSTCFSAKRK